MKKLLAIVMAVAMLMAMSVTVSAEEVILSEDTLFFSCGNWEQYDATTTITDLIDALATPGCYLVITRSAESDALPHPDGYEKFFMTDSWWSGRVANDEGEEINGVRFGTANHTDAMATANGNVNDVTIDCVLDDGIKVWYDGAELYKIFTEGNFNAGGSGLVFVSNTSATSYKITNFSVVVPDEPIVAPETEEAPVEDTTTEAPAEDTTTEAPADEEPADTGLALAVVPAIVALAAVALSKKR